MTSGEGEKRAHPTPKSPKEHIEVAEAVEAPNEPASEPVSAEPVMFLLYTVDVQTSTFGASQTPEPVPEERPAEVLTHGRAVIAPICLLSRTPLRLPRNLVLLNHMSATARA